MEKITTLFQPIRFKRDSKSKWEKGLKQVNQNGVLIFDSNKNVVNKIYKMETCWF